jgi:TonB family protein
MAIDGPQWIPVHSPQQSEGVVREIRATTLAALGLMAAVWTTTLAGAGDSWEELNARVQNEQRKGDHAKARILATRALQIAEDTYGSDDPRVAVSLNNLGVSYYALREPGFAEPLLERAIAIWERQQKVDDLGLSSARANLGSVYEMTHHYPEAEALYLRALEVKEKSFGLEHPDVISVAERLCSVYRDTDREAEADALERRVTGAKQLGQGESVVSFSPNRQSGREVAPGYPADGPAVDGDIVLPTNLEKVNPVYPDEAKAKRLEGRVIVAAIILKDGSVHFARALNATNPIFIPSALIAAKARKYKPATLHGSPVPIYFTMRMDYRLR